MGVKLISEVLDRAPADLTSAELVVLLVLAESGRDSTRQAWPGMDELARRCRLSVTGVRAALRRLAGRGLECRMPVGADRNGRPVFAHSGHQTTYRVPKFDAEAVTGVTPNGDTSVTPSGGQRRHQNDGKASRESTKGVTSVTPFPSYPVSEPSSSAREDLPTYGGDPQTLPEPLRTIRTSLLTTDPESTLDEARAVGRLVADKHRPRTATYYTRIATAGGFGAYLGEVRTAAADQRRRVLEEQLRTAPPCEHGQPGGDTLRTAAGELLCPLCRRGLRQPEQTTDADPRIAEMVTVWRDNEIAAGRNPTTQELVDVGRRAIAAIQQGYYHGRTA